MTEAAGRPGEEGPIATHERQPLALALGLLSFSVLLYEILLTRIFSVVLLYHFAYLAISLALLGFSLGALWVHYRPALHAADRIGCTAVVYGAAYALSILGCVLFLIHFRPAGVDLYEGLNLPTFRYLLLSYAVATVPFVLSGICVSALLTAGRDAIGRFYGFDLLGAALGAIAAIPVLDAFGAPRGMLLAAAAAGGSGLLPAARARRLPKLLPAAVLGILLATWALSLGTSLLSVRFTKGTLETEVLFERWNSFSRITAEPKGRGVILRIDSGAASRIYPASRHARLAEDIHTPAMYLRRGGDILIIGPGGGMEVAAAATLGLGTITGVEINPIVAELATVTYRKLAGDLYDRDGVRILTAEGRSFLRHADRQYDIIMLALVDTWAATAAGAFALSENNLYTVEAFSDYLSRLRDDGILSITRWYFPERPREALRLVALGRAALEAEGVRAPGRHLVVIEQEAERHRATFLMKKDPFSEEELAALESLARRQSDWRFLLAPRGEHHPTFTTLATTPDPQAFYRDYERDVSPPTDDRPFFFYVIRPGELWSSFERDFRRLPEVTNVGVFLLVSSVVADGAAVVLLIGIPLLVQRRGRRAPGRAVAPVLAYFACLGAGFMMIEVVLMQKFILFLGHPTRALVAVLFVLLCAGGAGSLYCGRHDAAALRTRVPLWLSLIAALGLAYAWGLEVLFEKAMGLPVEARVGLSAACLAPLGFLLGTCFPGGVRLLEERAEVLIPWVWAINGATSVLGSALAMLTAMNRGFGLALLAGFGMYALALVCVLRFRSGGWQAAIS